MDPDIALAMGILAEAGCPEERPEHDDFAAALHAIRAQPLTRAQCLSKARYVKLQKSKRHVSAHMRTRIAAHNTRATRAMELIDVDERKAKRQNKTDRAKWLPSAILRVCFAAREQHSLSLKPSAMRMRRLRGVRRPIQKQQRSSPHSRATRALADGEQGATNYIQRLRDAAAQIILDNQKLHASRFLERSGVGTFELSTDETDQKISEKKTLKTLRKTLHVNLVAPALVLHGIFTCMGNSGFTVESQELCLPMLALKGKTANCMMHGASMAMRDYLEKMTEGMRGWTFIFIADSAKSNPIVFRQLVAHMSAKFALYGRCFMHLVSLAIAAGAEPLRVVGPTFCGPILLHTGATQSRLEQALEDEITEKSISIIVDSTLSDEDVMFRDRLLGLLHWDEALIEDQTLHRPSIAKARLQKLIDDLKTFLQQRLGSRRWTHLCRVGCCEGGRRATAQRLRELLLALFLWRAAPVPALNKWTCLYPALSWWCVAAHLGFIKTLWGKVFEPNAHERNDQLHMDMLEPTQDNVLSAVNKKRATKVLRWLRHPKTPWELLIVCIALRPVLSFMGWLFKEERATADHSVTKLIRPNNAAHTIISFMLDKLQNLEDEYWSAFAYEGWSEMKLQLALNTLLAMSASFAWRIVRALEFFPWRAWIAVDPAASLEAVVSAKYK